MLDMPFYSPEDFSELIQYARMMKMCTTPGCTTCGAMPFRKLCYDTIGYENICGIVRAVTPEYFAKHYTFRWMQVATILDFTFYKEGRLPRDNYMMQELDRLSRAHEEVIWKDKTKKRLNNQKAHVESQLKKLNNQLQYLERQIAKVDSIEYPPWIKYKK